MIAAPWLILTRVYRACGFLFAVPFGLLGVKRIDPHAAHGSWGFRLLIFPGTMAFWPLRLRRWMKGISAPPEERNAHRRAANQQVLDLVAEPVPISGNVERQGDWLIFRAEPKTYQRVK